MSVDKYINWGHVSRSLCGTRSVLTRSSIPKKHKDKVDELRKVVKDWEDKHVDKSKQEKKELDSLAKKYRS